MTHWHQQHPPSGRILLMSGEVQVGAIFPPERRGDKWVWKMFIDNIGFVPQEAKTELAAKNALLADWQDWLRKAGLTEKEKPNE